MRKPFKSLALLVASVALLGTSLTGCNLNLPSSVAKSSNVSSIEELKPSSDVAPASSQQAPASSQQAPASSEQAPASSVNPNSSVAPVELVGIEIASNPDTIQYYEDEDFDPAGLVVNAVYSDGTKQAIADTDYEIEDPDMSTAGEVDVIVTYEGKTASFKITILEDYIVAIAVYKQPTKVEYERNEAFSSSGLVVAGQFASGAVSDVTAYCTLSEPDMSEPGTKTITISIAGTELTASFNILVKVPTQVELVIKSYPTKTSYNLNEALSLEGLEVAWLMSDGSYDVVDATDYVVDSSAVDLTTAGQYPITITMGEKVLRFNVGVLGEVTYTYNTYTSVSPSNWNELTYQDSNDTQIMSYLGGSFFSFNFAFDNEGKIIDGGYQVEYDAVSALEDVTATYAGDEKYAVPADATKGYAYKFTLRNDLQWDDGTPIHAIDFVETMKRQEDPDFFNYRADSFYNGDTIIHNAKDYLYQGSEGYFSARSSFEHFAEENYDNLYFRSFPVSSYEGAWANGDDCEVASWFKGKYSSYWSYVETYGIFIIPYLFEAGVDTPADALAMSKALDKKSMTEIQADATLKGYWDIILGFWQTDPDEELDLLVSYYQFPAVSWDSVGIKVGANENELIVILDKTLNLFKEDGTSLSYKAAYNFSSLPLVKLDLYDNNKVAPKIDGGLWTSKYNSSVETSASWGPYKLTYFQSGKQYILDRNPNWYGKNMAQYAGQYQTDRIVCDTISSWNTAWLAFQQGDIASIGIDVSIAADYKNSSRAVFTADDYVGSMQLQSNVTALAERSSSEHNKMMLAYADFRKAISLCIDRDAYCQECTTSSLKGFGLFNSMHYYDVENGGVYRNEDVAKEVICNVYGVDLEEYDSLDEAYAAVSGFNLDLARELVDKAYAQAVKDGVIGENDIVKLTVGASTNSEAVQRQFNFLKRAFETLAVGTNLEGRLTLELDTSFGSTWANSFRDGKYDICTGGWTGAAWNPGYFLLAYLSPDYMYSKAWQTDKVMLTYNPYQDGNPEHDYEMSLLDWYDCLNGAQGAAYNWSEGEVSTEFRLGIIAQLEEQILLAYYTVPMYNFFSAQLVSYKIEFGTKNYNTFMGYGGMRYITYKFTDAAWASVKASYDYKN